MSSNDNIIPLFAPPPAIEVELPSDVENNEENQMLNQSATQELEARRQQMIDRLLKFVATNADHIDCFMFSAQMRQTNSDATTPCFMSTPLSLWQEAFMLSSMQALHSSRMLKMWTTD